MRLTTKPIYFRRAFLGTELVQALRGKPRQWEAASAVRAAVRQDWPDSGERRPGRRRQLVEVSGAPVARARRRSLSGHWRGGRDERSRHRTNQCGAYRIGPDDAAGGWSFHHDPPAYAYSLIVFGTSVPAAISSSGSWPNDARTGAFPAFANHRSY
jgi:hypothetical protein